MQNLAIINIGQLITIAGPPRPRTGAALRELSIIEDAALICRNGIIKYAGKRADLTSHLDDFEVIDAGYSDDVEVIDAGGLVVTPGLIDAHTHPIFAGYRENEYEQRIMGKTYQEIAAAGGGIRSTVQRTRAMSEEDLLTQSRHHAAMMLKHGTTTAEAKSGYGLSLDDEIKCLRVIERLNNDQILELVPTFLGAHEIPDEYRNDREGYIELLIKSMLPAVSEQRLAQYCDIFCESHVFSAEESRRILSAAKENGFELRMHADQLTLCGGAHLAADLGAKTADHLEQIDDASIEKLLSAGVIAVLLPGSVFHLGLKKYPPARQMIEAGLPIVLATDFNPGSSPTPSLPMVMSIACTQMRMTPAEALVACTINAASSLNRAERLGSLERGKQADIVIFDCQDYRQIPYFFGANLVKTVIKRGSIVQSRQRGSDGENR
jgi:imidazolonepropionase